MKVAKNPEEQVDSSFEQPDDVKGFSLCDIQPKKSVELKGTDNMLSPYDTLKEAPEGIEFQ